MNICVLCSARDLEEKYKQPAKELARLIAQNNHDLIWGGSDTGLMNIVANGVQNGGGKIVGISIHAYKKQARKQADEMIIARDLGQRKALMLKRADAIIALPGGVGTLDEVTDFIELKKHGAHIKPIVILNTDEFYAGLLMQLQKMKSDNFIQPKLDELVRFAKLPADALAFAESG